jgi:hypothetical protein
MDFSALNKATADSFHQQKALIKKVLAGKAVRCPSCKTSLVLNSKSQPWQIECSKGCTDIQLETE